MFNILGLSPENSIYSLLQSRRQKDVVKKSPGLEVSRHRLQTGSENKSTVVPGASHLIFLKLLKRDFVKERARIGTANA